MILRNPHLGLDVKDGLEQQLWRIRVQYRLVYFSSRASENEMGEGWLIIARCPRDGDTLARRKISCKAQHHSDV